MKETSRASSGGKEPLGVRLKRKWDDHWYHYKVHTWLVILVVFCIALFVGEKLTEEHPDVYITYIGSSYVDQTFDRKLSELFSDVITDVNEDGKKIVQVKSILFGGSEDMMNLATLQQADVDLMAGRSVLYLVDSFAYETFIGRGAFVQMETSQGEFSYIDLSNNRLLNGDGFHFEDVYLCQRQPSFEDGEDEETKLKYQNAAAIAEKILQYQ